MRWTLAAASIVIAGFAQAGDMHAMHPAGQGPDANNDGVVTREEAKSFPRLAETFAAADKNKDGQLDQAEMTAHREAMHEQMRANAVERWKAADKDGTGSLSRDEAKTTMPHVADDFDRIDANKDGQVSSEEMREFPLGPAELRSFHHALVFCGTFASAMHAPVGYENRPRKPFTDHRR